MFFSNSVVFFSYSYECNASCEKCLNRYHLLRNVKISQEVCCRFLDLLKRFNYDGTIEFGSGESLIVPGFVEFVQKVLQVAPRSNVKILSNGKCFNKYLSRALLDDPRVSWGITFDGFFNEDLIGLQKGIDIEKVKQSFRDFEVLPKNIYINYTLTSKSVRSLCDFLTFCKEIKIPKFYITPVKIFTETQKISWARVDFDSSGVRKELLRAKDLVRALGLNGDIPIFKAKKRRSMCWCQGRANPVIDLDGTVSFCLGREDVVIGNILDADIVEKWKRKKESLSENLSDGVVWCECCSSRPNEDGIYPTPRGKFKSVLQ